jgi:SAM-dependent methyltransferase
MTDTRADHWETVYTTKPDDRVSWFEQSPAFSLELIAATGNGEASVIDIGGGASRLVDVLVAKGKTHVAVLDLSARALGIAKTRMEANAGMVEWIVGDVTTWKPARQYGIWHDRAAFHFLNAPEEQAAYAKTLHAALEPGGFAIIGTFALDGPEKCSGLPVTRHDAASIARILGPDFRLVDERRYEHVTPGGNVQKFQFSTFQMIG